MSLETAVAFKNFLYKNTKNETKNYLKELINSVEKKDETCFTGGILDSDKELIKNFIFDGYFTFHDKLLELINLKTNNPNNNYSILVRTWRTYNWNDLDDDEKANTFYIINEQNNNHNELLPNFLSTFKQTIAEIHRINDNFSAVFVRTANGEVYYLNGQGEWTKYIVPYPVTSIYRFEKSGYGKNVGDVYFGTTNGLYLARMGSWTATKINGIDDTIAEIQHINDNFSAVFVRTANGEVCYLNGQGELTKYIVPYPVTSIYRFERSGNERNIGDVYFGTTNGLYLVRTGSWTATKINGINGIDNAIVEIKHINGSFPAVFVRTINGEVYYVNGLGKWKYNVPQPVTSIYRFERSGNERNIGDVYFGTINGLYLAKMGSWTATKINGIDKEVISIQKDRENGNSVLIRTITGNACFVDGNGNMDWYNVPYSVTSIYRFEKGGYGRNIGEVYLGTKNGLYLSKPGNDWKTLLKINNIQNNDEL